MKIKSVWTLLVCLLWTAGLLLAQIETAEVLGTVTDPSGAAVSGASVTLSNQDTGFKVKSLTDAGGNYVFFSVKPGRYTVTVERTSFATASAPDIIVNVNAR